MKFVILQWRAIIAAIVVMGLCVGILRFVTPVFFISSIGVWGGIVFLLFRKRLSDREFWGDVALLLAAYIATILLMSLTEWRVVTYLLMCLSALSIGAFVSIIETEHKREIQVFTKKTFRRILVMGWVFVCGSFFITIYAISLFFPNIPMWLLFIVVGIYTSGISYAVWRMYYPQPMRTFSVWLLIMAVMNMELFWVLHLLPFGYIVLGFFSAWAWYILLLMIRFHMSAEGVIWKKQRWFLLQNAVLFILLLFVIRWI